MHKNPNYLKEYYQKNKEKHKAYYKEYWKKNREKLLIQNSEYGKKWYQENKEKVDAKNKKWYQENPGKSVKYVQKYVRNNKEKVNKYNKKFGQSIEGKYRLIKYRHQLRWKSKLFTIDNFTCIVESPCIYCGDKNITKGIDRMDNHIGYIIENSVSCCKTCNYMKNKYTVEEFLSHVEKIYKHSL